MAVTRNELVAGSESPGSNRTICAVVIAYQPGSEVAGNVRAIRQQVPRVIVVDNGASAASRASLRELDGEPGITRIENPENLGIATALNQGLEQALAEGFAWVATFDQDSLVPPDYFAGLLAGYERQPPRERDRVAVLVPLYRDRHLGFVFSSGCFLKEPLTGDVPIPVAAASGNLVSVAALRAVGGFRDDFFIGYVDFEFCLRCRQAGWLVLEIRTVVLEHAMGKYELRPWLGGTARINDYNASRRYYNARNQLIVYARWGWVDLKWSVRDFYFYSRDFMKLLLFCEDRAPKVRAILTGYWHAITGRRGPWQPGKK